MQTRAATVVATVANILSFSVKDLAQKRKKKKWTSAMNLPWWKRDMARLQRVIFQPLTTQQIKSMIHYNFLKMIYHRGRWSSARSPRSPSKRTMLMICLWPASKVKMRKMAFLMGYWVSVQIYRSVSKTPADGSWWFRALRAEPLPAVGIPHRHHQSWC